MSLCSITLFVGLIPFLSLIWLVLFFHHPFWYDSPLRGVVATAVSVWWPACRLSRGISSNDQNQTVVAINGILFMVERFEPRSISLVSIYSLKRIQCMLHLSHQIKLSSHYRWVITSISHYVTRADSLLIWVCRNFSHSDCVILSRFFKDLSMTFVANNHSRQLSLMTPHYQQLS